MSGGDSTDLPPEESPRLTSTDPWCLPDDWTGWVYAGALGWKRVKELGWSHEGALRAMWFEFPVDMRIGYLVPVGGACTVVNDA